MAKSVDFKPGANIENKISRRQLYTAPPNDWEVYPFYGYADPPLSRSLTRIGVDGIIDRLIIKADYEQCRVGITISERDAANLTYDQRWIIQCNIMWMIHEFLGRPMTQEIILAMKSGAADVIRWLASIESTAGDFGQNDIG
jgi:hypothetical protein